MDSLRRRAQAILDRGLADDEARSTIEALLAALDRAEAMHEAHEQQLAAQAELLTLTSSPILRVRADTLCVPLIGPVDADRTAVLTENLLAAVARQRARLVVLDLSGAIVIDSRAAGHLGGILRAIQLLGAHGALSGLSAETARLLAEDGEGIRGLTVYPDLAAALAAPERAR